MKSLELSDSDNDYKLGYIAAVANMVSSHDIGVPAEEALIAIGITSVKELKDSGCSDYDFKTLKQMVLFIERTRSREAKNGN